MHIMCCNKHLFFLKCSTVYSKAVPIQHQRDNLDFSCILAFFQLNLGRVVSSRLNSGHIFALVTIKLGSLHYMKFEKGKNLYIDTILRLLFKYI